MNQDLDLILPLVTKPCRYTGGELNAVAAEQAPSLKPQASSNQLQASSFTLQADTVRACLVMPDVYEIGMSNYGLRILYHVLNRRPDTRCERAFTPWPDMADKLKGSGMGLFALESRRPLSEFDILGFFQ